MMVSCGCQSAADRLQVRIRASLEKQAVEQERLIALFLAEISDTTFKAASSESESIDLPGPTENGDPSSQNANGNRTAPPSRESSHFSIDPSSPKPRPSASHHASSESEASKGRRWSHTSAVGTSMHALLQAATGPAQVVSEEGNVLVRFVKSTKFDAMVGAIIVLNLVTMAAQLEYDGWSISAVLVHQKPYRHLLIEDIFFGLEHLFTVFFAIELVVRLIAQGLSYLKHFASCLDALIVLVSSLDSWVLTPLGETGMSNLVLLRLLRLVRLSKVFRVFRVMRVFGSLRVLVKAVTNSIGALFWSMALLFIIELSASLLMARLLHPYIQDSEVDPEVRSFLFAKFGTCVRAFLTMFELTMAPGAFIAYRWMFDDVGVWVVAIIHVYVCLVTFAVIRVITAMFLRATLAADKDDSEEQAHVEYVKLLESATQHHHDIEEGDLHNADAHRKEETIQKDDLQLLLALPRFQKWLTTGALTDSDAHWLYDAMWQDSNNCVYLGDYLTALMKMRGPARATDIAVQLHEMKCLMTRVSVIEKALVGPRASTTTQSFGSLSAR